MERMGEAEFNRLRGVGAHKRKDTTLYSDQPSAKRTKRTKALASGAAAQLAEAAVGLQEGVQRAGGTAGGGVGGADKKMAASFKKKGGVEFFRVSCRDNGVGMGHKKIPQMLGVVLSSTK